jgi:hypothetical protein
MSLVSKLNSKRKLAIAVVVCSQIMIGCGGGGDSTTSAAPGSTPVAGGTPTGSTPAGSTPAGSTPAGSTPAGSTPAGSTPAGSTPAGSTPAGSTPAGSTPAGSTPVASKIDLKTAEGSKKAVATAIGGGSLFEFWDRPGSKNSIFGITNLNTTTNCELGGTSNLTVTNPDNKPSAGDQYKITQTNCRFKDTEAAGYTETTGTATFVLESIQGDPTNAAGISSSISKFTAQSTISGDVTEAGVRYVGNGTTTGTGTFTSSHDGRGTITDTDDTDTFSSSLSLTSKGTINGTAFSINTTSKTTNCITTGYGTPSASTRCELAEATVVGTSPSLGDLNFKVVSTTAIGLNDNSEPISGKLSITQGSETITVEFSVNAAKQPIVILTSSAGIKTTLLYSELLALGDSWI